MTAVNGRHARYYRAGRGSTAFYLPVTYHRVIRGKVRQLTVSPRLLAKTLRSAT